MKEERKQESIAEEGGGETSEAAPELSLEIIERAPQEHVRSKVTLNSAMHLKKWTRFADRSGDFWSSLPASTRIFALISLLDALLVVVYAFWQFRWVREHIFKLQENSAEECQVCAEHQHVVLSMLVTALFFLILVWDSISHENDFELLASMVLSAVVTGRVVFFLFTSPSVQDYAKIMGLCLSLSFETITIIFAYMTYKKFGWRVYSKLACDLRLKNGAQRRNLYFKFHRFNTFIKLDLQFLVILVVTGVTMAVMLRRNSTKYAISFTSQSNMILLFSTVSGCIVGLVWLAMAFLAVDREKLGIVTLLEFTCPLTFLLPILSVVSVYASSDRRAWEGKESLLVATALYVLTRICVWVNLRSLTKDVKEVKREGEWSLNDKLKQDDTNPDLIPMLKGAWLLKPSPQSPNKRRFFQLSQDRTTLRWAWNKYVILYYVDELIVDDDKLTITLVFSMEPDLVLGFKQPCEYEVWKRGLALLLTMLMAPDPGTDRNSLINRPGRSMLNFNFEAQSTNMLQKVLGSLGIVTNRGHAELRRKKPKHRISRPSPLENEHSLQNSASGSIHVTPGDSNVTPSQELSHLYGGELVTVAPGHFKVVMPEHLIHGKQPSSLLKNKALDKENSLSTQDPHHSGSQAGLYRETSADSTIVPPMPQAASIIHGIGLQMPIEIIDHDDLEFGKFLGAGAEGAVWAAWYLETPVAIKKTDSMNELEIIVTAAQHDNIVGFRGISKNGSSTFLVMEYCPRGTLDVMLHHTRMTRWDLTKVLQMVRGIARGMLHLHTRKPPILHRDLKPGNIFIGHGLVMKIGDFGMSRHVDNEEEIQNGHKKPIKRQFTSGVIGTPAYSAPELTDERLQSREYNQSRMMKADVYSFGVCLWEIIERERPFAGMTYYEIATQWLSNPEEMKLPLLTIPKDGTSIDRLILNECQDLVMQCTSMDTDKRPDFKTILKRFKAVHNEIKAEGMAAV